MIRYVLAVLLAVAIVGLAMPAVNDAAVDNSEAAVRGEIADLDAAATALVDTEEVPPPGRERASARRVVTVTFPEQSPTSRAVRFVRIEPHHEHGFSTVTYAVGERPSEQLRIDATVVGPGNGTVRLGGSERRTLVLTLVRDDAGNRVVELRRQ